MSDLRDFGMGSTQPSPIISEPIIRDETICDSSDFAAFHKFEDADEDASSNRNKIAGAVAAALFLGAAGVYGYVTYTAQPQQVVATNVVAKAPPPAISEPAPMSPVTPEANAATPVPDADQPSAPALRTARKATVPVPQTAPSDAMATTPSDMTQPLPTPPSPPSSSVAAIPSQPASPTDSMIQPTPDQTDTQSVPAIQQPQQQATPTPAAPVVTQGPQAGEPVTPAQAQPIVPEQPVQQ